MTVISNFRFQHVLLTGAGIKPTIPSPTTLIPGNSGFKSTDIMKGEFAHNLTDDIWYYRNDNDQIVQFGGDGIQVSSFNGRQGAVLPAVNDYTWAQINKANSSIGDITSRSHSLLTDIGSNSHAQIDAHISNLSNPHVVTKSQVGLGNVANLKNNFAGTADPTVNDDDSEGYAVGSKWVNLTDDKEFTCVDASAGSAVWKEITFAGSGTTVSSIFGRSGDVVAATGDYTWAQINKTVSSLADITTKSHTVLSDIGVNTHAQIDTHIADATKHRTINDAGVAVTDLWSASKINSTLAGKADASHTHDAVNLNFAAYKKLTSTVLQTAIQQLYDFAPIFVPDTEQTTNNTAKTYAQVATTTGKMYSVVVYAQCLENGVTKGTSFRAIASFRNEGGTLKKNYSTDEEIIDIVGHFDEINVVPYLEFVVNGTNIDLKVKGESLTTYNWTIRYLVIES